MVSETAVIVPSFKSNCKTLCRVIDHINRSKDIKIVSIIVIDYGTPMDKLVELERKHDNVEILKLSYDPGLQYMRAIASYHVMKKYSTETLVFVDNDVFVLPYTICKLIKALEKPEIASAAPVIINASNVTPWVTSTVDISCFTIWEIPYIMKIDKKLMLTAYNSGACFALKASAFRRIGYGSKSMKFWYEDLDIGLRLWRMGYKTVTVIDAIAYHLYGLSRKNMDTPRYLKRTVEDSYVGRIMCLYRNSDTPQFLLGLLLIALDVIRFNIISRRRGAMKYAIRGIIRGFFKALRSANKSLMTCGEKESKELKEILRVGLANHFRVILKTIDVQGYVGMLRKLMLNAYGMRLEWLEEKSSHIRP